MNRQRNFNLRHPERGTHEVFVGNLSLSMYDQLPYVSKRRGVRIYTCMGVEMAAQDCAPVFVLRVELERHLQARDLVWQLYQHGLWLLRYNFNHRHPELHEGEIFLCNDSGEGFRRSSYATKRLGERAYGPDGRPASGVQPVFVSRAELLHLPDGEAILKILLREGIA